MDAPVIGAETTPYSKGKSWDVFTGYRYQKSDRHFVGPEEQVNRTEEGSQVINWLHLLDATVRYNISDRSSVSLSIPYLIAERSNPIRDAQRVVVDRSTTHSAGYSDIVLGYRRWMLDPESHPSGNFSLGAGIKIPTGQSSVHDTFKVRDPATGVYSTVVRPVDQSIQPGDGGLGYILDTTMFLRFGSGNVGAYASGTYLFNPRETNELNRNLVPVPGSINEHLSVADQYIARFGLSTKVVQNVGFSLGMRLEGVPSSDVFGGDEGFRRPGYAWSVEPSLGWAFGSNSLSLAVPFAVYRNRTANLNDEVNNNGEPGDAAFADYLIMVGFGHHF